MIYLLFIITILIFIISGLVCEKTGQKYYDSRICNRKTTPKVYDILHKYLPDLSDNNFLGPLKDIYVLVLSLAPFLFFKESGFNTLKEYLILYCFIILTRSIFINLTILPKNKNCENNGDLIHGCYDKIFSGHFATLFLATLIFYKHGLITNTFWLSFVNIVNVLLIILTRSHYTSDIAVSFIVTLLFFTNSNQIVSYI